MNNKNNEAQHKISALLEHIKQGTFKSLDYDEKYELVESFLETSLDDPELGICTKIVASGINEDDTKVLDMKEIINKFGKEPVIDGFIRAIDNDMFLPGGFNGDDKMSVEEKVNELLAKDEDELTSEDKIFLNTIKKLCEEEGINIGNIQASLSNNSADAKFKKRDIDASVDIIGKLVLMMKHEGHLSMVALTSCMMIISIAKSLLDVDDEKSLAIFGANDDSNFSNTLKAFDYLADLIGNNWDSITKLFSTQSDYVKGILHMMIAARYFANYSNDNFDNIDDIADVLNLRKIIDNFEAYKEERLQEKSNKPKDKVTSPPKFDNDMFKELDKNEDEKVDELIKETFNVKNRDDLRD